MNILLLSPYDAVSHQYWRTRLVSDLALLFQATVETVTLPPRYFSWRFRGNSLTLAHDERLQKPFDLIIATSMTDLSALKGMAPHLGPIPSILYFHENQFAYPDRNQNHQLERQMTSIYSAISSNALVFNSEFNRQTFFEGANQLLQKMPDGVPPDIISTLNQKSRVISVPIDSPERINSLERINSPERINSLERVNSPERINSPERADEVTIVWNHRWEYDKGLDELLEVVDGLIRREVKMRFHLIGQQFRTRPAQIDLICQRLGDSLGVLGHVNGRAEYLALLFESDLVLSTARQEFQGIAVLEAVAAGCWPVVPDSLAYQEYIPKENRYGDVGQALEMVARFDSAMRGSVALPAGVQAGHVRDQWQQLVEELLQ